MDYENSEVLASFSSTSVSNLFTFLFFRVNDTLFEFIQIMANMQAEFIVYSLFYKTNFD